MNNLISVIIPTHNRPVELERALRSVLTQTHTNFELIVVIDGDGRDKVQLIIDTLNDPRIRCTENNRTRGGNGARNTGLLQAKGDFIAYLDDDDEWLPGKLTKCLASIQAHDESVGVVLTAFEVFQNGRWKTKRLNKDSILLEDVLFYRVSLGSSSNLFFRSKVFDAVGIWDEGMQRQQDLELMVRVLERFKCLYAPEVLLKVYGHNLPNPERAFDQQEQYLMKIKKYLTKFDESKARRFYAHHNRLLANYLIRMRKYREAFGYYLESIKYGHFLIKKDIRLALQLLQQLTSTNKAF